MACLCLLPCSLMCLGSRVAPVPSYTPFSITLNKCWWGFLTEELELLILENDSVWTLSEVCSHRLTLYNTLPRPCIWSSWAAGSPVSFIEIQGYRNLVFTFCNWVYISEIPFPSYFEMVSKKRKEQRYFHSTIWKPEDLLELNFILKSVF